jgi:hypothetical protein
LNLKCIQTATARDCSGGPPVSPHPTLFQRRSHAARVCADRERRGRAAAGHAVPPDCHTGPTLPPRLATAWQHPGPSLLPTTSLSRPPFSFPSHPPPQACARALHRPPSFLSLVSTSADRTAATAPPSSVPFGPRLTTPVPSSSCRTHQHPPRPPELRRRIGTPPRQAVFSAPPPLAIFGENLATPPCLAQPLSVPR